MSPRFLLATAVVLAFAGGRVSAQADPLCDIGVFADADGTLSTFQPAQGDAFDVYVVMFAESLVNAVALQLVVPGLGTDVLQLAVTYGPNGAGLNIPTNGGYNIGLGECAVGFFGSPLAVAKFTFLFPFESFGARTVDVAPNPDENPEAPAFSDCQGRVYTCNVASGLFLEGPVSDDDRSFGGVKALYAN